MAIDKYSTPMLDQLETGLGGLGHQLRQQQPVLRAELMTAGHHPDAGPAIESGHPAQILTGCRHHLVAGHPVGGPANHGDVGDFRVRASVEPVQQIAGHRWGEVREDPAGRLDGAIQVVSHHAFHEPALAPAEQPAVVGRIQRLGGALGAQVGAAMVTSRVTVPAP